MNIKSKAIQLFKESISSKIKTGSPPHFETESKKLVQLTGLELSFIEKELSAWFKDVTELAYLEKYLRSDFEEISLNDENSIVYKTHSDKKLNGLDVDRDTLFLSLLSLSNRSGQNWSFKNPFVSFYIKTHGKNLRITLIHQCLSPKDQFKFFIRAHISNCPAVETFNFSENLKEMIHQKANIIICGETGSGKTTLIRSLLQEIPPHEHLIILEDTFELATNHPQTTHLVAHPQSGKGLKDYCSYALRLSPDRIILGEIRSGEIIPFVLSMNTGHRGMISSIHANSAADAITRMATLFTLYSPESSLSYQVILDLLTKNIDYTIYIKEKKIKEVVRIIGANGQKVLYESLFGIQ